MASVLPLVSWLVPLLSCTIAVQASCEGDSCAHAAQSPSLLSVKSELHSVLASATATLPGLDLSDGNGSTLNDSVETMIRANLAHDFEEHHNIPDPATNQTEGDSGMGSLGRNIEFMFLKVAELETIVELQQAQIMSLTDRLNAVENKTGLVQKEVPKESIHHPQHPEKVQNIFKKVWKKHHYQREKKRFVTPDHPAHPSQKAKAEAAKAEAKKNEALLQRHQQENHQEDEDDEVEFQEDSDQDVSDDFDGDTSQSLIDSETNSLSNSTGWRRRRRRWIRRRIFSSVVNTVSNAASSAVNSVTNTMADAYSQAADKVAFVANTAIDSVEMAVDILTQGFSDWSADCPEATKPSLNVDSNGVSVNWGRQKCRISLMGQRVTIFDFNFGSTNVNWPEPLKTVAKPGFPEWSAGCPEFARPSLSVSSNGLDLDFGRQKCEISMMGKTLKLIDFDFGRTSLQWPEPLKTVTEFGLAPIKTMVDLGRQAVNCATGGGPLEVFKCFGLLIIEQVPPLSFLTRMGDMIQEFIEVFAVVAKTIVKKVIEEKASLLSEAATSKFPRIGESPAIHHASKNLAIKKHTRRGPGAKKLAKMKRASKTSLLQDGDDDGGDSDSLFEFEIHDNDGNYATKLITQFAGKEIDTASCLAFAPKTRSGSNGAVAQSDWQVNDEDDFIKLEPWAVPCDNSWMMDKDHLTKWAGYSFYTWEMAIEKCVTVSYALSMQPVLAFVGGLEFDILPAPLADIDTMVCWPDKQPGGVDLSVLRTVISSGGVMLYSRTLRLVKRFGDNTDFTDNNIYSAYETYRNPAGVAVGSHSVEDDRTLEAMDRTASLLQNRSQTPPELVWRDQELYLATMEYGKHLEQTILSEHRDHAAAHRLGLLQTDATSSAKSGADEVQLFRFRNPGLVSFEIKGEMVGNQLDMVMQVSFGGFNSPEKRIKLVDLVDQFAVVLTAMPFVSVGTKAKAIAALKGFNEDDVKKVVPKAWDLASTEYEADWSYSFDHEGWSFSPPNTAITGFRRSHENNLYNLEEFRRGSKDSKVDDFGFPLSDDSPKTLAEEELRSPPRTARAKKPTGDDTPSGMQARDSSVWDTENNEIHSPIQQLRFNPLDLAQGEAYMAVNCMEELLAAPKNSVREINLGSDLRGEVWDPKLPGHGDARVKAIAEALKVQRGVYTLRLTKSKIGLEGMQVLTTRVLTVKTIKELDLTESSLGADEAEALAEELKVNDRIKTLTLTNNNLGDQGAEALAEALFLNRNLKDLFLNHCEIGFPGAEAIVRACAAHPRLTGVNLQQNHLKGEGQKAFHQLVLEVVKEKKQGGIRFIVHR